MISCRCISRALILVGGVSLQGRECTTDYFYLMVSKLMDRGVHRCHIASSRLKTDEALSIAELLLAGGVSLSRGCAKTGDSYQGMPSGAVDRNSSFSATC